MVEDQPQYRTGKLCYIEIPDPAASEVFAWFRDPGGNTLGIYQQPGLAQTEASRHG